MQTAAGWKALVDAVYGGPAPCMIASDFEHRVGCMMPETATDFPWAMAVAVADDTKLWQRVLRSF